MGRNRAIKEFDPKRPGQPLDLFEAQNTRLPVVLELLRSPWIMRASDLPPRPIGAGKRVEHEIDVVWDGTRSCPASFTYAGRRYPVDALVQTWSVERSWWDLRTRMSRRCFRVLARGGLYDLAYDRIAGRWLLTGIGD